MPNLKERINNDLKQAMRNKEAETVSVLRMLASAVKDREISMRKGEDVNLSDDQVLEVLSSEVKKRKDSIIAYERGGRADLAAKEKSEIKILEKYLPKQMSDEELDEAVREAIEACRASSPRDFGKIMGAVMPRVKGKADGNRVGEAVKRALSGLS